MVHGFVLMENHYHLLVETSRATLVKGMQYLNSTCTQRYNVRHELSSVIPANAHTRQPN
ncbi:MAG: hypothetical protein PHV34_13105 [Verrucomicrobiae bacterium]|nr:hypothetical protein [Verrucomicrobiae bacterium]